MSARIVVQTLYVECSGWSRNDIVVELRGHCRIRRNDDRVYRRRDVYSSYVLSRMEPPPEGAVGIDLSRLPIPIWLALLIAAVMFAVAFYFTWTYRNASNL